jgi:hypothetical protein
MFKDWLEARKNSPHLNKIVHPFDWTFSTDYAGTVTYTQVSTVFYSQIRVQILNR